jgi:serine/threonine protein phosphatase PrpC
MTVVEELLLFDAEQTGPLTVSVDGGVVEAYSARGPNKERNEDSLLVAKFPGGCVLAVADGMGGMSAGDRASRIALETLVEHLHEGQADATPTRHSLLDAIEDANRRVLAMNVGAGTTLAALVIAKGAARPVHVGDSICLHVGQRGRIKTSTVSHSPIGYAVEAGILDEVEAMHHEHRHLVSNHVGSVDMRIEFGASVRIAPRDTLLVASDGLTDNLAPNEIVQRLRTGPLAERARELAELAGSRMRESRPPAPSKPDDLSFLLYRPTS